MEWLAPRARAIAAPSCLAAARGWKWGVWGISPLLSRFSSRFGDLCYKNFVKDQGFY
jgi:hypothetical protein